MFYLFGTIFPIASYILQIYPRIFNKYFGVDVWTLLIEINLIRKNGHSVPKRRIKKGFIIDGYFDYPPLFLVLLSFLPKKFLFNFQGFISPLFDAMLNIIIFFIVYQMTQSVVFALVAQLIYTTIPVAALENSALLPRSLGYSLFMLSFFFAIVFTTSGNQIALVASIILATLTLLSHKFATQSLFFISIFFTIFEKNLYYIGILLSSIVLAVIVSRGYYINVLKSHVRIIHFWIKNRKNRFAHQVYGNISLKKNPDLIGIIYKLLTKLAPVTLLSANFWIFSIVLFLILQPSFPILINKMVIWIAFFYVFGVLVLMIPQLTPIGEGYRYIEMTTLPTAIVAAFIFFYLYNSELRELALAGYVIVLVSNLTIIIFTQKKAIIADTNRSLTGDLTKMYNFINKLPTTPRIMCIPHQITTMTVYNTRANVLVNFDVEGLQKMSDFYPVFKKPIIEIAKKFDINYILLRENFAKLKDLKLTNSKVVYRSGENLLIELN